MGKVRNKMEVTVPILVELVVLVDTEDKQEALDRVFNADITGDFGSEQEGIEVIEWEWNMHEKVVEGNVYHGGINEPRVREILDYDDEDENEEDEE